MPTDSASPPPRSRRLTRIAVALTCVLFGTIACATEPSAAERGACGGQTVRIGFLGSSPSDAPMILADKLGYFAEEGIEPDFYTFDSAAKMVAPLGAGHLDVGGGAPSAGLYNAVARGVAIRIVADKAQLVPGYGYMPLLVRKELVDSGKVTSARDLVGMKVAEPAQGTTTAATLNAIMAAEGHSYQDVTHSFLRFPEHATALGNGAVDASVTTEPSATIAEERGVAVRLTDSTGVYPGQQLAVLLYSQDFTEDYPDTGVCFMRAYLKAVRTYLAAVPDGKWTGPRAQEISDIIATGIGMEPDLLRTAVPTYIDPNGEVNSESLRRDYDFFAEQDYLESEVAVDQLIDPSFAERAVRDIGRAPGTAP